MTMASKSPKVAGGKSQTIERAALILSCFSNSEPYLTLNELASRLGLNPSTTYRYVNTLQAAGLLERDEHRRGYRLGLGVIELAGLALDQIEVRKQALDEMDRLHEQTELLVNLAVPFQGDVLHIAHSAPKDWPRWKTTLGRRSVAYCTALGKVLLAYTPWEEVRRNIEHNGWRPCTQRSIQDFDRLQTELERVREQGFSVDDEERAAGISCIGVPIRDHSGHVIAALSVSGTTKGLTPNVRSQVLPRLLEAANRISLRLGNSDVVAYLGST